MTGGELRREDIVVDGKLKQFRVALQPKLVHHAVLVEGDRSRGDEQEAPTSFMEWPSTNSCNTSRWRGVS